jgi:antitoxin component YwqK of YwqJK toxin-antitoxin module
MKNVLLLLLIFFATKSSFSQQNLNDSSKNGKYLFYTNNKIEVEGNYKDQKRHGIWTWYNPDSSIRKKVRYKKGRTLWIIFYEQNKVWLKIDRYGKRRVIRACDCREY